MLLAFTGAVDADAPGWLGALLASDVVLWLDVAARFVTLEWDDEEGRLLSHRAVAHRYARRDLALDVAYRWPWDACRAAVTGAAFSLSHAHLARLLSLRRALGVLHSRVGSGPRFVGPAFRLAQLCTLSLVALHWYACLTWRLSLDLAHAGRRSWLAVAAADDWPGTTEPWPWPLWAQYVRAYDRALSHVLASGERGGTHAEVAAALAGQAAGVAWLAYFTSNMVQLVTNMNAQDEHARAKIGRVAVFCRHAGIPPELDRRVKAHLEHVLLAKKLALDTDDLLAELSAPLRAEVALHRCHSFLLNPKFVGILGVETDVSGRDDGLSQGMFIKVLVDKLHLVVFSPGDFAVEEGEVGEEVYFLSRGSVAIIAGERQVATLSGGDCFGEIALLVPGTRRTASIVALTFCEAHQLMRQDFEQCLHGFPEMHARIRKIAEARFAELQAMAEATRQKAKREESERREEIQRGRERAALDYEAAAKAATEAAQAAAQAAAEAQAEAARRKTLAGLASAAVALARLRLSGERPMGGEGAAAAACRRGSSPAALCAERRSSLANRRSSGARRHSVSSAEGLEAPSVSAFAAVARAAAATAAAAAAAAATDTDDAATSFTASANASAGPSARPSLKASFIKVTPEGTECQAPAAAAPAEATATPVPALHGRSRRCSVKVAPAESVLAAAAALGAESKGAEASQ